MSPITTLGKLFISRSNGFKYDEIVRENILNSEVDRKDMLTTAPTRKIERLIAKYQKQGATREDTAVLRGELQRRLSWGTAFKRCYAR